MPKNHNKIRLDIDILLKEKSWLMHLPNYEEIIKNVSEKIFDKLNFINYVNNIEFSVTLTDDKYIQDINRRFRKIDKPTNVLSFPTENISPLDFKSMTNYDGYIMIGDVLISIDKIIEESINDDKPISNHFTHLTIHGILHLIGYDHETEEDATMMENLEIDILSEFNIKSPYN